MIQMPPAERVKVKRDGPRGWHWIAIAHYDPARHELVDPPAPAQVAAPAPVKRGPGRPRKQSTEATNGDR
jgi:hypothetical protein